MEAQRGTRRRRVAARPQVEAAVGICAQGARNVNQTERLMALANELGVPVNRGDPCAALADALGDEWATALESAAVLAEREARDVQRRAEMAALRRARAERQFYGPPTPATGLVVPQTSVWHDIGPDLRLDVIDRLTEMEPRTVLALYQTDNSARAMVDRLRRRLYYADRDGRLAYGSVPLIDYLRLALVLGKSDPMRLFLAAALCTLRDFADRQVAVTERADPNAFPGLGFRRSVGIEPRGYRGRPAYSTLIDPVDAGDPRPVDLADAAAQWRQWLAGPPGALVGGGARQSRVVDRYRQVLGWPGPSPLVRDLYNRTGLANVVRVGGDPDAAADDTARVDEIRWLGTADPALVANLFGTHGPIVQEWLSAASSNEHVPAADRLQDAVDSLGPDAADLVLGSIAADVNQYVASRACAIAAKNSPIWPASLPNLLGGSTFWLVPWEDGTIGLLSLLSMPAIDEAVALASRQAAAPS
ncbi:hypothetical protein psal_cds_388 [Pandoravirus salinus]|uniref:Uncharacterized protein n=1 Tax=Pandoravirus salinus TaxID=1349410 RepID=S4W1R3_9VIRU|nr:hypothetical protein psal_cds_388 [Pandoravirus salinus]AGO84075.1 hypothetical protein psal_cds_388 [Pandoravirus salinus]